MGLRIELIRSKRAINRERGLIHVRKVAFQISLCSSHRESGTTLELIVSKILILETK